MGAIELGVLLFLLLTAGKGSSPSSSAPRPNVPQPSVPVPAPPVDTRAPPAATAPPPGVPATPAQAANQNAAAQVPPPWPQTVPQGLPPFPGPGWRAWSPVPAAVVARANQLLPELWRSGAGTRKTEQTGGVWTTYLATQMGTKRGVTAHKLVATPGPLANA